MTFGGVGHLSRWRGGSALFVLLFALMTAPAMGSALPTGPSNPLVDVIVQAVEGHEAQAAEAVVAVGGRIGPALPIVNGFSAQLPAGAEGGLVRSDAIRAVTGNHRVNFEALSYDEATTASNFVRTTGAGTAWSQGFLGDGVGVAVIDTGISPINDLAGRIVNGPDLSGEGTLVDTYGHGTVMAGIIGGSGADASAAGASARSGVAPHATLVGVKVAGANGVTDVSNVLQAMHWVSAYKDQFNIRVLSLSWGTPSTADPAVDPLDYAVERLWRQGITVVVSAGNSGPQASITKPGDDPVVITAGAVDDKQNTDPADDSIPPWSSRGPTAQGLVKPDVVAPGRLIVAPRSFGSTIERQNPKALYPPSYIRGSGTSEAAAVTAGVVALLVQAHPDWSPDQIKAALKATASPLPLVPATSQGAGRVQLASALAALPGAVNWQTFAGSGLGNLESSRGGIHSVTDCNKDGIADVILGEITYQCQPWNGQTWTGQTWTGQTWTGQTWTGQTWTGQTWTGQSWTNATWTGQTWTGGVWSGQTWTGQTWTGQTWTGQTWTGQTWTGVTWTGQTWAGQTWTGQTWTGYIYDDSEFLTAFWGKRPKAGKRVAGEVADDQIIPGVISSD